MLSSNQSQIIEQAPESLRFLGKQLPSLKDFVLKKTES